MKHGRRALILETVLVAIGAAGPAGLAPAGPPGRTQPQPRLGQPAAGRNAPGPRFHDVTEEVGLRIGGGPAAWSDLDGDGLADLVVDGAVWLNEGGRKFSRAGRVALGGSVTLGDFDNDGRVDAYSAASGKLSRNLGEGRFEDVTSLLPPRPMKVSLGAVWGDWDGDGFLDLYVGGYEIWETQEEFPDVILKNEGGKRFTEVWRQPGRPLRARGVTAADWDADGDLDIYVSNYRLQPNLLWRNDGRGKFTDVARSHGAAGDGALGAWGHTIGSAFGDLDGDGLLDLFVGNFSHPPAYQDRPQFLRNRGPKADYRFEDRSARAGLAWQESYASPALGDYDNDGDLDLFFTTVYPGDHSVLYRNNGDWTFTDVTDASGIRTERTYQAAWADYDGDGDLDLVSGGRLWRNDGPVGRWLELRLLGGPHRNRPAIGAIARIPAGKARITRHVESATGQGNQNDTTLHFGLGQYAGRVQVLVTWPGGATQKVRARADQVLEVRLPARLRRPR